MMGYKNMGKRKLYSEALKKARPEVNRWANEAERADRKVELAEFDAIYASQGGDAHLVRKKLATSLRMDKVANSLSRQNAEAMIQAMREAKHPNLKRHKKASGPKIKHEHKPDGLSKRTWRRANPGQQRGAPWMPKP